MGWLAVGAGTGVMAVALPALRAWVVGRSVRRAVTRRNVAATFGALLSVVVAGDPLGLGVQTALSNEGCRAAPPLTSDQQEE